MYRPNFCSECGAKILRLHWHAWTSRRFCNPCSGRLLKQRLAIPLMAVALVTIGVLTGRALRPAPPPLTIERRANSPLSTHNSGAIDANPDTDANIESTDPRSEQNSQVTSDEELIYICGARTKKGTPCARRVHSHVRCWQHKGSPAMLPPEKLIVRE